VPIRRSLKSFKIFSYSEWINITPKQKLMVAMKASHVRIKALMNISLEKMKAMHLEAKPKETESEVEHEEVPKEGAIVETGRALNKLKEWTQGKGGAAGRSWLSPSKEG
jgi:hypothetical protein